ncbi:MAG: Do family serine endopeptidase [Gammaproteobacteria bacterium]|nr:MAG: Do family serine endopeptidase [Gammaproteobacteria bacterium]
MPTAGRTLVRKLLPFLLQSVLVGLLAAGLLYVLEPDLFHRPQVVQVVQSLQEPSASRPQAGQGPVSYADAVARAAPAVVNIYTAKIIQERPSPLLQDPILRYFFGDRLHSPLRKRLQTSLGSGVIVSPQGYILTNLHVVRDADQIEVLLQDGRTFSARLVGTDPDTDLAVLHVHARHLPTIVIGDSDRLRVGDVVLAIGNPFGVGQTVTMGIVSAKGRSDLGLNTYEDFIQTDAAINPGNSGGALINARGELVGINSAIFTKSGGSEGIGFAIPVSMARTVMQQIIEHGRVIRGWLGIEAQDLTPSLAQSFGLDSTHGMLIAGVLRDGPADRAGLEPGDVITAIAGRTVHDAHEAMALIAQQAPGSKVEIRGIRQGHPFRATVVVGERPVLERPAR